MLRLIQTCLLLVVAIGTMSTARTVMAATQTEIDTAYAEIMNNPTDRTSNLRYSAMLAQAGDYEAAVPPLERLLVNEPHNAWLMLQLGILYKSLNSPVMARTYLQQAANEPSASEEVTAKAKHLISSF